MYTIRIRQFGYFIFEKKFENVHAVMQVSNELFPLNLYMSVLCVHCISYILYSDNAFIEI